MAVDVRGVYKKYMALSRPGKKENNVSKGLDMEVPRNTMLVKLATISALVGVININNMAQEMPQFMTDCNGMISGTKCKRQTEVVYMVAEKGHPQPR